MDKAHQKHTELPKADYGNFHRLEWAILGAPCGVIQGLARAVIQSLGSTRQVAYIDADHREADQPGAETSSSMLGAGAFLEYTDKIEFARIDRVGRPSVFQQRSALYDADAVLLNGNHFEGKRQIVVIDPRKEASLQKRLGQLSQVDLILLAEGQEGPYPFLLEHLNAQQKALPPVLSLHDVPGITLFLQKELEASQAPLMGLVLAGGKSLRMGQDKGAIAYHGIPQREYAAQLLSPFCEEVFLSIRPDQLGDISSAFPLLPDTFLGLGPLGAILSAFREKPNAAWLVIACDLPLLHTDTLAQLVQERHCGRVATAFQSPENPFPEPLIAIWEPRSYPLLLQFLAQGVSCPRKTLINSSIHLIHANDASALTNVNSPEEMVQVKKRME
jgi:molybdopterin-guanine dinucleotide biosynthesis protein A